MAIVSGNGGLCMIGGSADGVDSSVIADPYSVSKAYAKGDLVMINGHLYSALEAMEAGEWDATKWQRTNVGGVISVKANASSLATVATSGKSSDLNNDAGFLTDAPADGKQYARKNNSWAEVIASGGTGNFTQTVLYDCMVEGSGTISYAKGSIYTLRDNFDNYDWLVIEVVSDKGDIGSGSDAWNGTVFWSYSTKSLKEALCPNQFTICSFGNRASKFYINGTTLRKDKMNQENQEGIVRVYGINFGGSSEVYSTEETPIGKWIDGSTIYRNVVQATANVSLQTWTTIYSNSSIKKILNSRLFSTIDGATESKVYETTTMHCRVQNPNVQIYLPWCGANANDYIILEYTKN